MLAARQPPPVGTRGSDAGASTYRHRPSPFGATGESFAPRVSRSLLRGWTVTAGWVGFLPGRVDVHDRPNQ